MDQGFIENLSSFESWQKWICWSAIEDLSMAKRVSRWIKNLLRIYRADREHRNSVLMDWKSCWECVEQELRNLDGLRSYREETQKSRWIEKLSRCYGEGREHKYIPWWIENLSKIYWERRKTSSIERNLLRIYREAVKLEEKEFFKEAETQGNICNKQATQPKIQTTC